MKIWMVKYQWAYDITARDAVMFNVLDIVKDFDIGGLSVSAVNMLSRDSYSNVTPPGYGIKRDSYFYWMYDIDAIDKLRTCGQDPDKIIPFLRAYNKEMINNYIKKI